MLVPGRRLRSVGKEGWIVVFRQAVVRIVRVQIGRPIAAGDHRVDPGLLRAGVARHQPLESLPIPIADHHAGRRGAAAVAPGVGRHIGDDDRRRRGRQGPHHVHAGRGQRPGRAVGIRRKARRKRRLRLRPEAPAGRQQQQRRAAGYDQPRHTPLDRSPPSLLHGRLTAPLYHNPTARDRAISLTLSSSRGHPGARARHPLHPPFALSLLRPLGRRGEAVGVWR